MPYSANTSEPQASTDTSHMLPAHEKRSSAGPMVGIAIILLVMLFGALYFWGASMNREQQELPLIPGDSTETGV